MISDKYQYIFVHVPKCAGSSIEKALLQEEVDLSEENFNHVFWCDNLNNSIKKKFLIGKIKAGDYAAQHYTSSMYEKHIPEKYKKYFKFAFVRNPWDKVVSEWKYFSKIDPKYNSAFKEVVCKASQCNRATLFPWGEHEWPQLTYVKKCNFIGRFENLQQDFDAVCDKIGIPQQKLPHQNKTKHKHYSEYYDNETRQIIAQKYAQDIEYFGYKFGE